MWKRYEIGTEERAVLLRGGKAVKYLKPGVHRVLGSESDVFRFLLSDLVIEANPSVRALIPKGDYEEVRIGRQERGVLFVDEVPKLVLRPGVRRFWTIDPGVTLRIYDAREPITKVTHELMRTLQADATFQVVADHEQAFLQEAGRFVRILEPGLHVFWKRAEAPISVMKMTTQAQSVLVSGQDLITRDKVSLRLTLTAEYRVVDVRRAAEAHQNLTEALYLRVQLATRDFVSGVRLDELLEGRDAISHYVHQALKAGAAAMGIEVLATGVKDIILPGDMKLLLNRVIEAEKEAAAKVILRREEVAAMRALANSAKVLEESPGALRLKEMEALRDIAGQVGEMVVVLGENGLSDMRKLLPGRS